MTRKIMALVVAAGVGERLGGKMPKQYQSLDGRPMLQYTLDALRNHPDIDGVRAVVHPQNTALYKKYIAQKGLMPPVHGGAQRQDSVRLGLESLKSEAPDLVLIHDAARPFVNRIVIDRVIAALEGGAKAVVPVLAVTDTLKTVEDGQLRSTVERAGFCRAQTPQGFDFTTILELHRRYAGETFSDDAMLAEQAGLPVHTVAGTRNNEKITTREDWMEAEWQLQAGYETRCGSGYDIHRLLPHDASITGTKRKIRLCGVNVPSDTYLDGHSDADVALHALVDAMLGVVGEGDIGTHFPPSDPKWRRADSRRFVLHAHHLLKQHRGELVHADITLIAERPRLKPHYGAMRLAVAEMLSVPVQRVSVKSTTSEKLDAVGREEAITAQALVTVRLPRFMEEVEEELVEG